MLKRIAICPSSTRPCARSGAHAQWRAPGLCACSLLWLWLVLLVTASCRSEREDGTLGNIVFSHDTVRFDSVFSGQVSSVRRLTIRNAGHRGIRLDRIALRGGASSEFALLIDGVAAPEQTSYLLRGKDSLLVVVRVRPKQGTSDTITSLEDAIHIAKDGASRSVVLMAKGLASVDMACDTLKSDLDIPGPPARILARSLYVPPGKVLRLGPGAALYFRPGTGLRVAGSLVVEGESGRRVTFAGERLETFYRRKPGQWQGIQLLKGSGPHRLRYAQVRSAVSGIVADSIAEGHELLVEQCEILYSSQEGIDLIGCKARLRSSLLAQNYRHALRLTNAVAEVTHCTLYGVSAPPQVRAGSLLAVRKVEGVSRSSFSVQNSILWGDRENEVAIPSSVPSSARFALQYCVAKVPARDTIRRADWLFLWLEDPRFTKPETLDFSLTKESKAIGRALRSISATDPVDLRGVNRLTQDEAPDLGALERVASQP